jgi:hypothetical protein
MTIPITRRGRSPDDSSFIGLIALAFAVLIAGCASDHIPLMKSESGIRDVFLRAYHVGMPIEEFRDIMAKERVRVLQEWNRPAGGLTPFAGGGLMGDRVLWIDLGMYQSLTHQVYVSAFVGFAHGRLADCAIRKSSTPP